MAFKWLLIVCLIIAVSSIEEEPGSNHDIKDNTAEVSNGIKQFIDLNLEAVDLPPETGTGRKIEEYNYPTRAVQKDTVKKLLSEVKPIRIEGVIQKLSSYHSRNTLDYFGEYQAEDWLTQHLKKILANFKGSIYFIADPLILNPVPNLLPYKEKNIIVRIEGQDKAKKEQLVILAAHYDSIIGEGEAAWVANRKTRAPGADDNATGCSVLMEVLRLLVQSGTKLKHTLEFHFYGNSEIYLKGPGDVARQYKQTNMKVKGLLSLDSLGHGSVIGFAAFNPSDKKDGIPPLVAFVKMLINEYTNAGPPMELNCRKVCKFDFYAWHSSDYPAVTLMSYNLSTNKFRALGSIVDCAPGVVKEFPYARVFCYMKKRSGSRCDNNMQLHVIAKSFDFVTDLMELCRYLAFGAVNLVIPYDSVWDILRQICAN
ncbi:unnamed protein product [Orchesella dallaii]|uniref:Peptidase M28 domain-containing protein n=1 Tax=Orchesella dallaii TaxID=48710 RepID=A0ABP1S4U6_9HEXA